MSTPFKKQPQNYLETRSINLADAKELLHLYKDAIKFHRPVVEYRDRSFTLNAVGKAINEFFTLYAKEIKFQTLLREEIDWLIWIIRHHRHSPSDEPDPENTDKDDELLTSDRPALDAYLEREILPQFDEFTPSQPIIDPTETIPTTTQPPVSQVQKFIDAQNTHIKALELKNQFALYTRERLSQTLFEHLSQTISETQARQLISTNQDYLDRLIDWRLSNSLLDQQHPEYFVQQILREDLIKSPVFGLRLAANSLPPEAAETVGKSITQDLTQPTDKLAREAKQGLEVLTARTDKKTQTQTNLLQESSRRRLDALNQATATLIAATQTSIASGDTATASHNLSQLKQISLQNHDAGRAYLELKSASNQAAATQPLTDLKVHFQSNPTAQQELVALEREIKAPASDPVKIQASLDKIEHYLVHQQPLATAVEKVEQKLQSGADSKSLSPEIQALRQTAASGSLSDRLEHHFVSQGFSPADARYQTGRLLETIKATALTHATLPQDSAAFGQFLSKIGSIPEAGLSPQAINALGQLSSTEVQNLSAFAQIERSQIESRLPGITIPGGTDLNPRAVATVLAMNYDGLSVDSLVNAISTTHANLPGLSQAEISLIHGQLPLSVRRAIPRQDLISALKGGNPEAHFAILKRLGVEFSEGNLSSEDLDQVLNSLLPSEEAALKSIIEADRNRPFLKQSLRLRLQSLFSSERGRLPRPQPSFRFLSFLRDPVSAFRSWFFPGGPGGAGGAAARGFRFPLIGGQTGGTLLRGLGSKLANFGSSLLRGGSGLLGKAGSWGLSTGLGLMGRLSMLSLSGVMATAGAAVLVAVLSVLLLAILIDQPKLTAQITSIGLGGGGDPYQYCDPTTDPNCAAPFCNPAEGSCDWPTQCGCFRQLAYDPDPNRSHNKSNAIDIGVKDCPSNQRGVYAMHDGVVTEFQDIYNDGEPREADKKRDAGYGNYVKISATDPITGGTYHTIYAHLSRGLAVSLDKEVQKGQLLGLANDTGWSTGPHLHFEYKGGGLIYDILPSKPVLNTCIQDL